MRRNRLDIAALAVALLVCAVVLAPSRAFAEWDLQQIGQVKQDAEQAYEAGDYVAASRHYIELRRLLKTALEAGEVPEQMRPQAHLALAAASYQLGRTNQQSGNCEGAVTVYDELVADAEADAGLRARARARLAESQVCVGRAALDRAELAPSLDALEAADGALDALDDALAGELTEPPEDVPELLSGARTSARSLEADLTTALMAEISRATDRKQCDELATWLELARMRLPVALPVGGGREHTERCKAPTEVVPVEPQPQDTVASADVPWWPGLIVIGVGGATLIGGAVADGLLAGDVDTYDDQRGRCLQNDLIACRDARRLKGDIESQQSVVVALYVTGGIVTAAGVVYTAVTASMALASDSDDDTTSARFGLVPTPDGAMSVVSFQF